MDSEPVKDYEGKFVRIEYNNGFKLFGTILKVYTDSISFKTEQKTSLISLDAIKQIMEADY